MVRVYNNIDNYEKVVEFLKFIEEYGKDINVWNYCIGYFYYYLDNYLEVEKYFLKVVEFNFIDLDFYFFLCWIY